MSFLKKFNKEKLVETIDDFIERVSFLRRFLQYTKIRDNREKFSKLRTLFINNEKPLGYSGEKPLKYASNEIVTSKYTLLNFLPKNLFEQFRRIANFYFLINIIILWVLPDPPTSPYTAVLPLLIVISVTAIKQAYEDIKRHRLDTEINGRKVTVIRNTKSMRIKWRDIRVGDLVKVERDTDLPCDMIVLFSSNENGTCHIKTANLDGETNLKIRYVPYKFPRFEKEKDLIDLNGVIQCEKPNTRLHEFKGTLQYKNNSYALQNDNLLLRGTTLKVAKTIYGCAIYTGMDTKMMKNSKFKSNKMSCIERKMNSFVFIFIVALILMCIGCLIGSVFYENLYKKHWYLIGRKPPSLRTDRNLYRFIAFMFYMNLNYIIPLSLYVTLEVVRLGLSRFFEWDIEMYDPKTDQPAKANSTDLPEDLGQIEYLFSDKTGTLTENEMVFKCFSLDGKIYEETNGVLVEIETDENRNNFSTSDTKQEQFSRFLELLSLCHTVQVDEESDQKYNAASPDELSFINFCQKLDIIFDGDEFDKYENKVIRKVIYNKTEQVKTYELMHVLEFDSVRKRMSVLIKDNQTQEYILYCKGADVAIFPNSVCNSQPKYEDSLKSFSENGWRTLVLAYRILTRQEYETYDKMITDANNDVLNRNQRLADAYNMIETDLTLVGVTAVEDKLQEDVDDTIRSLRKAGIKIWVLTGDKLETAVNISESCKHFSPEMGKLFLANLNNSADKIKQLLIEYKTLLQSKQKNESFAFIVDGPSLVTVFESNLKSEFRDVTLKCDAVLCCRMSPGQKAQIVSLVKESKTKPLTCAIGDGANDVSMIQEADVGIGIFGKEGRNAARAADFAFARFKFLKRALLVHGYLFYSRIALLVLYFFYKNLVFAICQLYYGGFNGFSSASLYPPLYISFFNLALSSAPIFILSLFEKRFSIEELTVNPYIYRTITRNKLLSFLQFAKWNIIAIWHSSVSFFLPIIIFSFTSSIIYSDGKGAGSVNLGQFVLLLIFFIVHIKIFIIWRYQTVLALLSYLASLLGFVLVCLVTQSFISFVPLTVFTEEQLLYYTYFALLSSGTVWLTLILASVIAIIPDIILSVIEEIRENRLFIKLEKEIIMNNPILKYANSNFFIRTENENKPKMPKNYRVYPSALFDKPITKLNQLILNNTSNNVAIYV